MPTAPTRWAFRRALARLFALERVRRARRVLGCNVGQRIVGDRIPELVDPLDDVPVEGLAPGELLVVATPLFAESRDPTHPRHLDPGAERGQTE
jgi:hypothetical protein